VRERAAYDWCTWEDALIAGESAGSPGSYSRRTGSDRIAFVRLCAHYFGNQAWLSDGQLLADVGRISGVPGRLVHGRNDIGCPPQTAWELAKAWPAAQLALIDDSGHTGSPAFAGAIAAAIADFSRMLA
jgi:proline iminopeptidase